MNIENLGLEFSLCGYILVKIVFTVKKKAIKLSLAIIYLGYWLFSNK